MRSFLTTFIAAIATVASISSWAGGYLEINSRGFTVVLFAPHGSVGHDNSRGCRITSPFGQAITCVG